MNHKLAWGMMVMLGCYFPAHGQGVNARIIGTVTDQEGNGLAGVVVTALNTASNAETAVVSETSHGKFRFLGLAPGIYQVSFDLQGYVSYAISSIRLSAEQSINLHVKLKRGAAAPLPRPVGAPPSTAAPSGLPGRFSVAFRFGPSYLAIGDANTHLVNFHRHVPTGGGVNVPLDPIRLGIDWSAELGLRLTPKLEVAAGFGRSGGRRPRGAMVFTYYGQDRTAYRAAYVIDVRMKTFPLQLIGRYELYKNRTFAFSAQATLLYHFASWKMESSYYSPGAYFGSLNFDSSAKDQATVRRLGFAAGGHWEWRLDRNAFLIADLVGRYAPLRGFAGEREYRGGSGSGAATITRGQLWFFEYYDRDRRQWIWDLRVGSRPEGADARNVSPALVDFSGLAFRIGLMFRF